MTPSRVSSFTSGGDTPGAAQFRSAVKSTMLIFSLAQTGSFLFQAGCGHVMLLRLIPGVWAHDLAVLSAMIASVWVAICLYRCFGFVRLVVYAEVHRLAITEQLKIQLGEIQVLYIGGQLMLTTLILFIVFLDYAPFGTVILYVVIYAGTLLVLYAITWILIMSILAGYVQYK